MSEDEQQVPVNVTKNAACCRIFLTFLSYLLVVLTFPLSLFFTITVVKEYERAVIMRLGHIVSGGAQGPGLFFILPCLDDLKLIDMRTVTFDVDPQEILTKDSVTVTVDAVCYFSIFDPIKVVTKVENEKLATRLLASTTLRSILGTKTLQDIMKERDNIANQMQTDLDEATDPWGVKVERVEIKNINLPHSMQRSMATEAEAARDARAKVISAEGEQNASLALRDAADIISENPIALQLRYLQTLTTISAEKNSTIVFPIPIEMLNKFKSIE